MDVIPVPPELKNLSVIKHQMLVRILLFSKIMNVQNWFRKNWCEGQLVLFLLNIVEVAEKLPLFLCNAELVILEEIRENLQQYREFQINIERLRIGL